MKNLYTFFNSNLGKTILFIILFLFLFTLELNFVGFSIRNKVTIGSTLDFSWFSDSIERRLHGFLLGRDFTFTYGPLFQYIYSFPSIFFHVPSYISVALAPILSFVIIFVLFFYIAQNIATNVFERVSYLLFVFIVLGFLITSGTDTIKALVPMFYSILLFNTLRKKFRWIQVIIVSFLPTFFGFYTYNLFFTTCLITILLLGFFIVQNNGKASIYKFLIIIPLIVFFHLLFSFLLTHNFDYIRYSVDSIVNYRYVMNLPWTHDRDNILLIFPLLLILISVYLWKIKVLSSQTRNILYILIFASLIELDYAISRSDAGHLLWAFYPSILTFFSIVFVSANRIKMFIPIVLILYLLVPFKPSFYNTFSSKNIFTVIQVIKQKPPFFSIYQLPDNYYYSESEIKNLAQFAKEHKNEVYIYPYDSYVLNSVNATFNSFALGMYTYSNSIVETNTVKAFDGNPPHYILLGIDTKGTLNLDDIPNFTRNPELALWIIKNYSIKKQMDKYIVLIYTPNKKKSGSCQIIRLNIFLSKHDTFTQRVESVIKPAVYYLGSTRLPYYPSADSYLLFQDIYNSSGIKQLFDTTWNNYKKLPAKYTNGLTITRVDPFLGKKQTKSFNKNEYSLTCVTI